MMDWLIYWLTFRAGDEWIVHCAGEDNDGLNANVQPAHFFSVSGQRCDKAQVCKDKFWNIVGKDKAYKNNNRDKDWK